MTTDYKVKLKRFKWVVIMAAVGLMSAPNSNLTHLTAGQKGKNS